jgi:hypothetical protein
MTHRMRTRIVLFFAALALAVGARADVTNCACDERDPESLKRFECSLCNVAEKQPDGVAYFFLKDNNPMKPHRTLILPRKHYPGPHLMDELTDAEWAAFWTAAIAKARELWGERWGLAYNSVLARRQCHGHVHIGKLLEGVELPGYQVVSGPERIPRPGRAGMWIHPVRGKLHVHLGENITETVLLR